MWKRYPCASYGLLGLLLAIAGQFLTVHFNYGGDPTALFYTGRQTTIPDTLGENLYRAPEDEGFDGQFYHLIAHDPFLGKGYAASVDNPRLRWRRILVPLLAFTLALGRSGWIDFSYFVVTAGFVFLGTYWLSCVAREYNLHESAGLLFLTLPAVFMSLERMTVDLALAALTAGVVLYLRNPGWKLFAVLAAAPLARETGLILLAGYGAHALLKRDWRATACSVASGLPFGLWVMFVHTHTPSDATAWVASFPFSGLLWRTINPFPFEITGAWVGAAAVTDYLGILAIWIAILAAFWLIRKQRYDPAALAGLGFVLLAAFLGKEDVWQQTYGFSRIFSPWFILLSAAALQQNARWMLLPWVLSLPRIAVQAWVHVPGIVSGFARGK
jgi:hypothetical protein